VPVVPNPPTPPAVWNPVRLIQTLAYYQVVPFLGSLDWLFPPPPIPAPGLDPAASGSERGVVSDSALAQTVAPNSAPDFAPDLVPDRMIFDFRQPSPALQQIWGTVDDVVMGGVSESRIQWYNRRGVFSGLVSTGNGGGFASVRTRNLSPVLDLSAYEGLELRVRGDGQRYKFLLRTSSGWDSLAYAYGFETVKVEAGQVEVGQVETAGLNGAELGGSGGDRVVRSSEVWQTVRIPFAALRPVFRARTVADAPPFDRAKITSLQVMLSKFEYDGALNPRFEPGPFRLEIESIAAYGQAQAAPSGSETGLQTGLNPGTRAAADSPAVNP